MLIKNELLFYSPDDAGVFIIEDDTSWQKIITRQVEKGGHRVIGLASDKETALAAVDNFESQGVNVVTLDGNLSIESSNGADGRQILSAIRSKANKVKVIGLSSSPMMGVDVDLGKRDATDLSETITTI